MIDVPLTGITHYFDVFVIWTLYQSIMLIIVLYFAVLYPYKINIDKSKSKYLEERKLSLQINGKVGSNNIHTKQTTMSQLKNVRHWNQIIVTWQGYELLIFKN